MTVQLARRIVVVVLIGFCLQLLVVAYVGYSSYAGRKNTVTNQRLGCERGKLDRADNAAFQRAHSEYILTVTGAKSVKEDVKRAARKARKTFRRTSHDLTVRSKINCEKVFPDAKVFETP